jgi:hypothetical protein
MLRPPITVVCPAVSVLLEVVKYTLFPLIENPVMAA